MTTKQGTWKKGDNCFYKEVICRFGTPEHVVVDGGSENKKWTDLLFKRHNIRKVTVTPNHGTADVVIKQGHRPIADAVSKLTACSDELKEMWIVHLPAVLWADGITVRGTTHYSPLRLMFGENAVLPKQLENFA